MNREILSSIKKNINKNQKDNDDLLKNHYKLVNKAKRKETKSLQTNNTSNKNIECKRMKALQLAEKKWNISSFKYDKDLMRFPFFSISNKKVIKSKKYITSNEKDYLEVIPNEKFGAATIKDADILKVAISKAAEISNRADCIFPDYVDFTAYEMLEKLSVTSKNVTAYKRLYDSLMRLSTTSYQSSTFCDFKNTVSDESNTHHEVYTLISLEYVRNTSVNVIKFRIHFNRKLLASLRNTNIINIPNFILKESKMLKKRLLEIIFVYEKNGKWQVRLDRLQQLASHTSCKRSFKKLLIQYFSDSDYNVSFEKTKDNQDKVIFTKR